MTTKLNFIEGLFENKSLDQLDIEIEYFDEKGFLEAKAQLVKEAHKIFIKLASQYGGYAATDALLDEIHQFIKIASEPKYFKYILKSKGDV